MSSTKKIAEFPNVEEKLQKPVKQSAFERQRAEAEAKRKREAAETAAVYEDFVKSFDQGDDQDERNRNAGFGQSPFGGGDGLADRRPGFGGSAGTGKRHFGMSSTSTLKSGPGSLGPPPPSLNKKRHHDGTPSGYRDRDESRGRLGFYDHEPGRKISKAFDASDDEAEAAVTGRAAEKAISKPTLRLANLPPTTSPAVIKALMPANLTIDRIKIVPLAGPSGTERKSTTAIVTLSKETPASDIDATVSSLQNRYLGYGFYLNLHRHLSSAAISSTILPTLTAATAVSYPFGARRVTEATSNQPPQQFGYGRGYAPPTSYNSAGGPVGRGGILHVPVQPPKDIKKLRMIHKVIESVLEHGPEFEALLMSRPEVQREEKWAWLWDARSEGGIWYRWRLWEIVTGSHSGRAQKGRYLPLFEGSHAWKVPDQPLAYEYTTGVDGFISESEYDSSEEEDFDDEQKPSDVAGTASEEDMFLNPIAKSRLAHLLARLPTSLSKIRKGDIARVAAFAITHASKGSDEIVDMIVSNVEQPFAYTSANPDHGQDGRGKSSRNGYSREVSPSAEDKPGGTDARDASAARLIGLYVVSDILSSSSTSGVRHAWRYRQLFETALRERGTFESLGAMAEKYNWGRLRAEKWKRSVGLVLSLWEGWCVFPAETQEFFVKSFETPPQLQQRKAEKEAGDESQKKASNGRWKTLADAPKALPVSRKPESRSASPDQQDMLLETGDTDGEITYSFMGYSEDEGDESDGDIDGEPVGDVEEPQPVSRLQAQGDSEGGAATSLSGSSRLEFNAAAAGFQLSATAKSGPRKRMRAVDMFADSGSESGD